MTIVSAAAQRIASIFRKSRQCVEVVCASGG